MRCYFHLTSGTEWLLDREGVEVESIPEAVFQALVAIKELKQEAASEAESWQGWQLKAITADKDLFSIDLAADLLSPYQGITLAG
jgi:hypothetical protein